MSFFFYSAKNSFLHRLDPRVKIALMISLFALCFVSASRIFMAGLLCALVLLLYFARAFENLKKMAPLFLLIGGMTFILWAFFYRNGQGAKLSVIHIDSISYASLMSMRFINMLLAGLLLLSITSLENMTDGFMMLGMSYSAAFTITLSFRLVSIFISTGFTIVEAQKVRGNDATRGDILTRIKAYAPLLVPLILNGIKKAETLNLALESKGFSPERQIHIEGKYRMSGQDKIALVVMLFITAIAFFWRFIPFFHV